MADMEFQSSGLERVLKSFWFSLLLFVVWGGMTYFKWRSVAQNYDAIEIVWLTYNATIAVLFLIRSRPSVVSMDPIHWLVALVTSFSGFFFATYPDEAHGIRPLIGDTLIFAGLLLGLVTAVVLGRSYDFLPALRSVKTRWPYSMVRHPMYLASIVIRTGYLLRHFSMRNLALMLVLVWLYDLRAGFEERIMRNDERYPEYAQRVRFRFLPGVR